MTSDPVSTLIARIDKSSRGLISIKLRTLLEMFGYQAKQRVRAESLFAVVSALAEAGVDHTFPRGAGADDYITLSRVTTTDAAAPPPLAATAGPAVGKEKSSPSAAGSAQDFLVPDQVYRVLSLHGPWAWAIVHGGKNVENRSRGTPFRGRFLIHASSKSFNGDNLREARERLSSLCAPGTRIPDRFAESRIVGSVEVVDCVQGTGPTPWANPDTVNWLLRNPQALDWPHHVDGKRNLWTWTCPEG